MAKSMVQPYVGSLVIDVQDLDGTIVDAVPAATRGLRREKTGLNFVLGELAKNLPAHANTLGIAPDL